MKNNLATFIKIFGVLLIVIAASGRSAYAQEYGKLDLINKDAIEQISKMDIDELNSLSEFFIICPRVYFVRSMAELDGCQAATERYQLRYGEEKASGAMLGLFTTVRGLTSMSQLNDGGANSQKLRVATTVSDKYADRMKKAIQNRYKALKG